MMIIAINDIDATHAEEVIESMRTLGAPVIRAVRAECYGGWVAIEGSHRLYAAQQLGLTPEIEEIPYDEESTLATYGCCDEDDYSIADLVDTAADSGRPIYTF